LLSFNHFKFSVFFIWNACIGKNWSSNLSSNYTWIIKKIGQTQCQRLPHEWGLGKVKRQTFPLQNLRWGCFEPTIWWLSETALTTAPGLNYCLINSKLTIMYMEIHVFNVWHGTITDSKNKSD
jgi:hypothetical protein